MDYKQHEVISRAKSLRQRFADSRTSASSSLSPVPAARWQSHHKLPEGSLGVGGGGSGGGGDVPSQLRTTTSHGPFQSSSPEPELLSASTRLSLWKVGGTGVSGGGGGEPPCGGGSKTPSPSRTPGSGRSCNDKRPSSVSWMMTSPRGHLSRPATPTATSYHQLDSFAITSASAAAVAVAVGSSASGAQQVRQLSDDFAPDLLVEPSFLSNSKVGIRG